ncbi:AAA-ATPase At3g50940-like [Arachis duranensis]|uniref:AAA-ATPase At3g50940-like n=1 Tax=Arachis duranensis TaxID=130453 RepID=A0A6P4BL63_ARADU|nr:AAA-ATPase At3g50940-like [Arachis duranensis]
MKQLHLPSVQTMISAAASAAATTMLLRSLARDYVPRELHHWIHLKLSKLLSSLFFSSQLTLVIEEYHGLSHNHLFNAAQLYLTPHTSPNSTRFRVTMPKKATSISVFMDRNDEIVDLFNGVKFTWKLVAKHIPSTYIRTPGSNRHDYPTLKSEIRYYELRFHARHKDMVFTQYLPHVMEKAKEARQKQKPLKLFTLSDQRVIGIRGSAWQSVNLDHPATFDSLAMDEDAKNAIMEDLERFVARKDLYRKVGKAWKRGYLLYGPPGTGKSSLIAAMANYLRFDVYDLELTDVRSNSFLRKLLISTANRSILVVEDIDCSLELHNRLTKTPKPQGPAHEFHNQQPQVTLSGFLNFIDGLWSSCGDERIILFTTNRKDKIDPALLRPGRMDVHIHMSYCTPSGFKMLASNYLGEGVAAHPLFPQTLDLMQTSKVTPAEVGELLLKNEDSESALQSVIQLLLDKNRGENDECKAVQGECSQTFETQG